MNKARIQKRKFIRNAIIGLVSLIIVAFILNISPGYRRDKFKDKINLIINEENVTEELSNDMYVNSKGTIFLSIEDVCTLFDKTIFYDEKYNQIISSSDTKVAVLNLENNEMRVNDVLRKISDGVIKKNDILYIPISEMSIVYNIKTEYIEENNVVAIEDLSRGLIVANVTEDTNLKFKPKGLSRKVTQLKQGEKVNCFYTTSKGWRQVKTESGQVRISKSK